MRFSSYSVLTCLVFLFLFVCRLSNATDTLTTGQILKDRQVLESQNKLFRLRFYNPVHLNRYLAIQCVDGSGNKTVWVANRENPLNDASGYLNITRDGYLMISDEKGATIVINSGNPATGSNTSLTLLNSGNLVLKAGQRIVWQSFDNPTDTLLPGMKFGLFGLKKRFITSWLSPGVPSAGAFTLGVDPNDTRRFEVLRRGNPYWRGAEWNETNEGYYYPFPRDSIKIRYTSNENETYFSYTVTNNSLSWIDINPFGEVNFFLADGNSSMLVACHLETEFNNDDGCVEQKPSGCSKGDEFAFMLGSMEMWEDNGNQSFGLSDCEEMCRNNCSCTAFTSFWLDQSGCRFSYGPMVNDIPAEFKESIHVRSATTNGTVSPAAPPVSLPLRKETRTNKLLWVKIVSPLVALGLLGMAFTVFYTRRKNRFSKEKNKSEETESRRTQVGWETEQFMHELEISIAAMDESTTHNLLIKGNVDHDLPLFSFSTIETATENFSNANKLGQGGFGPVYKGILDDRHEIAVKRLSKRSGQGAEEFKNEVVLISKVQHRNLVRLFGCCIKGEEKLLIYEYLPNKSLDTFLFDETKRLQLDWKLRINIIEGIAQGLLYLHKFSRLKIIHRDLKTSNILLDNNMNPKISDFGTAKIFGENESQANTRRIVGTYGYMSPEYAMDGLYSVKSDVFSFGVMMLEIVSGKKNTGFYPSDQSPNLVRQPWNLWKEEKSLELMDPILEKTCPTNELTKCVRIALLCVQENAADRPTMSDVVSMLGSDTSLTLPEPKQSYFSTLLSDNPNDQLDSSGSINGVTISSAWAR